MHKTHLDEQGLIRTPSADEESAVGILAFHGRNGDPEFMLDVLQKIGWDKYAYALPRASDKTWYPGKFMAPIEDNREQLEIALANARKHQTRLHEMGIKDENLIIMGFSQGACLASQYVLQNPGKYKAVILLTGGYIGQEGIDWNFSGDFQQTPVLITTSEIDEWVPPGRATETANEFERLNAQVNLTIFKDRPHEISHEELTYLKKLIS